MDARALAEAALAGGDVAGALGFAREHLRQAGSDALPDCYPLLPLERAAASRGVQVTAGWEDPEVASAARLVPGMMQFTDWAQAFRPRPLCRLRLEQCLVLAPNVLLTAAGELLDDNVGFSNAELCRHRPEGFPGIAAVNGRILVAAPRGETLRIERPVVYLPASANYSAWLLGDLARLAAFDDLGELAIALHGAASEFHLASLAAAGVARDRVIACGPASRVECRELHYCTPTYFHHTPSPRALAHLRSRVAAEAGAGAGTPTPRRVYFARRRILGSRPILNEGDLVELLERYGFVAVDPEALPFAEQVRFAAGAETIAGPYGANLANAVFAQAARAALIVATKGQPEFSRLLSAFAIPHWHVVADPVRIRSGATFSESHGFRVDLDATETILRACLGEA
jgi:hypothetical protein